MQQFKNLGQFNVTHVALVVHQGKTMLSTCVKKNESSEFFLILGNALKSAFPFDNVNHLRTIKDILNECELYRKARHPRPVIDACKKFQSEMEVIYANSHQHGFDYVFMLAEIPSEIELDYGHDYPMHDNGIIFYETLKDYYNADASVQTIFLKEMVEVIERRFKVNK